MNAFELGDKEFYRFKELIYNEAGIKLSDMKKALVQARLSRRVRALGLNSYKDYYNYLINHYNEEKIDFINVITTNKTDFFRENKHFEFIKDVYLPEVERIGKKEIKIWSAGCSSGEEPYTIAITLLEYFENKHKPTIKILASDISTNVLEKAIIGIYQREQIEDINHTILKKYFLKGKGENEGQYRVKDSLKKIIYFRRLNLFEEPYPMKGQFDLIFCRNVIIYFDKDVQRRLFENFYSYLSDYGYLFIGHSENITTLTNKYSLVGHTIYKKAI